MEQPELYEALSFFREFKSLDGHDKSLEHYVGKYSDIVFREEITWEVFKVSDADLEGKDENGNLVLVEIKHWKVNDTANMNTQEHSSVGQIIKYASKHTNSLNSMRCFIVGSVDSFNVRNVCEFLQVLGLNITYISVSERVYAEMERVIGYHTEKEER